jgi:hypothetical protein
MDSIRATPMQYPTIGLLSDKLKELEDYIKRSYAEYGVDAGTALNLLGIPAVQQTAERIAYGEPLTTGKGMTTQVRPEVMDFIACCWNYRKRRRKSSNGRWSCW